MYNVFTWLFPTKVRFNQEVGSEEMDVKQALIKFLRSVEILGTYRVSDTD